jgi:hypothetical protein
MIAGMMTCLIAPALVVMEGMFPGWKGSYLLVFAFLASMEGILSERALQRQRITGWGYLASRGAEALILLLLLKLASYIPLGLERLVADAQTWPSDPYQFVSTLDLFTGLLFLTLWSGSLYVARMVRELDVTEDAAAPPSDKTSIEYYMWLTQPPVVRGRQERLQWLGEAILWGGLVLLLGSAAIRLLGISERILAAPVLAYFALGVALLTQARFSVTHAGWQVQRLSIQPGIARRWLVWAVVFLAGVALVALVLPTYYTMGPLQVLLGLATMLYTALAFLMTLLLFLLSLPLALFFPNVEQREPPSLESLRPPGPESAPTGGPPWLQVLGSAIFWLVVAAVVGYAFLRFWRDRLGPWMASKEAQETWWGHLVAWLRNWWQEWRTWRHGIQARLAQRRAERESKGRAAAGLGFFFPGRLAPRELVRYFYLSIARRAAQAGQPRGPGQTPYEYQSTLDERFPDLEPDLKGLTEAFVAARYGRQPVQEGEAEAVKPLWQRIKAILQRRRVRL